MKPSFRENAWCPLTFRPEEGSSCEEARWVGANSLAADRRRPRAHCPAVSGKVANSVKRSSEGSLHTDIPDLPEAVEYEAVLDHHAPDEPGRERLVSARDLQRM